MQREASIADNCKGHETAEREGARRGFSLISGQLPSNTGRFEQIRQPERHDSAPHQQSIFTEQLQKFVVGVVISFQLGVDTLI